MRQEDTNLTKVEYDSNSAVFERLAVIEEQGRQTLELMRSLIGLLLPSSEQTGPTVQELMAAIVAMQRDTIAVARTTQRDVTRLVDGLLSEEPPATDRNGHAVVGKAVRS
jgi:hypothetical protein